MRNYPDGMREADIPGFFDSEDQRECKSPTELRVIPQEFEDELKDLWLQYGKRSRDFPWGISPEETDDLMHRTRDLLRDIVHYNPPMQMDCPYDGDVILSQSGWDCPLCGQHHDHPQDEG